MSSPTVTVGKSYVDTPAGQLHYRYSEPPKGSETANSTTGTIFLLHMSASSSKCFESLMSSLSSLGYYCLAPDMPGFGESFDPKTDPSSINWYADLYYATFSGLEQFKNGCHLLGHHSGGVIGGELAAEYEGFCQSLTIIGPTIMSSQERLEMSKTFLDPFNIPVPSGDHLKKTWDYILWEGIPERELELLQRETLDHIKAWKGRNQIYTCVWAYDCSDSLKKVSSDCKILGLCARDDVLWPYFEKFKSVRNGVLAYEIEGGNFGPDRDVPGILQHFLKFIENK